MPTLKQISCSLQLGSNTRLKEYDHRYTDGGVEAFIAVPDSEIPFHIRVTSRGYIAPGLAAYVFMDGAYQCNRNRQNLTLPSSNSDNSSASEIEFKLRQKEEKTSDGLFVAREWSFAQLKTSSADRAPDVNPSFAQNVGTIEVVILRCRDGGGRGDAIDPAHTIHDIGSAEKPSSRTASLVKAAASGRPETADKAPSVKASAAKAASEAPSKTPSKAPSKVPSADDAFGGGMFGMGLFDGAGDYFGGADTRDQDEYRYRAPSYVSRRHGPPEYRWDARVGAYRHDPELERFVNPYGHGHRRNGGDAYSLEVQPRRSAPASHDSRSPAGSIVFVEESAKQIEQLIAEGTEHAKKHAIMEQEALEHRHEHSVFPAMTRALHRKVQEIASVNEEITCLYRSIDACMRTMNKQDWQRVRGYLHQQRILPEMQIELATPLPTPSTRRVEVQTPQPRASSTVQVTPETNGRHQAGSGKTEGSLWERKRREQNGQGSTNTQWHTPAQDQSGNQDIDGLAKWTGDNQDIDGTAKWTGDNQDDPWGAPVQESQRSNSGWDRGASAVHTPQKFQKSHGGGAWDAPNSTGSKQRSSRSRKSNNGGDDWDNAGTGGGGGDWNDDNTAEEKQGADDWAKQEDSTGNGGDNVAEQQDNTWGVGDGTSNDKQDQGGWEGDADASGDQQASGDDWAEQKNENKETSDEWAGADAGNNEQPAKDDWAQEKSEAKDAWGDNHEQQTGGWNGGDEPAKSKASQNASKQDARWGNEEMGGDEGDQAPGWDKSEAKKETGGWDKKSEAKDQTGEWDNKSEAKDQTGGWDNKPEAKNVTGDWRNDQKAASHAGRAKSKANSQAVSDDWGNDGAQPVSRDDTIDAESSVSALRPVIKPYWEDWAKKSEASKKPRAQPRDAYVYPAPAPVTAPVGRLQSVSHGVQAGRGAYYMHKLHRPEYLDTMQQPYAIFTFKYRSKDALEKILRRKIDTSNVQKAVHEVEQERLMRLPKDDLVAELMRRQSLGTPSSKASSKHGSKSASKSGGKGAPSNTGWGNEAAKAASKGGWDGEVKPSDSVSNVASNKVNGWEEIGQGQVHGGGSNKSKAGTAEHFAGDPQLQKNAGW